jgi:hypothetical protein
MESNVLSWNVAIELGYEPRAYPFTNIHVPLGEYDVRLDFKIWAKKATGISCYFTQISTNSKFQLTVYRRQKDKMYMLNYNDIDFKFCDINVIYTVEVELSNSGNALLKKAVRAKL